MKQIDFNLQNGKWLVKTYDEDFNVVDVKYFQNRKQAERYEKKATA